MENELRTYVPDTWDLSLGDRVEVPMRCKEFEDIERNLKNAGINNKLRKLIRVQNLYAFGQMLLREQFLMRYVNGNVDYYRVRRFKQINDDQIERALKYNIDERRIDIQKTFESELISVNITGAILIIQTVTNEPYAEHLTPERSSDYYIEYVAHFL